MNKQPLTQLKLLLFLLPLLFCKYTLAYDKELPGKHSLKQNSEGEYFVENEEGTVMIEPSILALGHSKLWILACIKNKSIDSDLKRMVFINLKLGGTTDSVNQENWAFFRENLKGLDVVNLQQLSEESCP